MPQLQIAPAPQTFGSQLGPVLGQALGSIGEGLIRRQTNKADESILGQLQQGNLSDMQRATLWSKLSPEKMKAYEPVFNSELRKAEATHKEELKRDTETKEKMKKAENTLSIAKKMKGLIGYTGNQAIPTTSGSFDPTMGLLNRKAVQKRNEFDALAASFASYYRDLETKGQLPQGLFESVIKPRLPNSELAERENIGRIEGLEQLARQYGGLEKIPEQTAEKAGKVVHMKSPDGQDVYIPEDQVQSALAAGGKRV